MLTQLPNDVLRLIIEEIPSSQGFYSLVFVNRHISNICLDRKIQKQAKNRFVSTLIKKDCSESCLPNGTLHGWKREYHSRNTCISALSYYEDGIKEGLSYTFSEDGKLSSKDSYRKGKRDGIMYSWFLDGSLFTREIYDHGTLILLEAWCDCSTHKNISELYFLTKPWKSCDLYERYENGILTERSYKHNRYGDLLIEHYNTGILMSRSFIPDIQRKFYILRYLGFVLAYLIILAVILGCHRYNII